jgi:hypothetical protein
VKKVEKERGRRRRGRRERGKEKGEGKRGSIAYNSGLSTDF